MNAAGTHCIFDKLLAALHWGFSDEGCGIKEGHTELTLLYVLQYHGNFPTEHDWN